MITYAVTSGTLPPGLTLSPEGVLAGTPAQAGPFSGVITATDSEGLRPNATQAFNMTIAEADVAPEITSSAPDAGQVGEAYTHTYTATGSGTITYSVTSGSLGDDLDLSSAGVISGTPTEEGTLTGVVTATNGVSPDDTQAFSIEITEAEVAPEITSSAPPGGEVDEPYTHQYTATGSGTITYSVTSGSLGDDLELSSSGEITGTPTEAGTLTGTVTATNGVSPDDTQNFSIEIEEAPEPSEFYTLDTIGERYTVPFSYNEPTLPTITESPVTVTTSNIGDYIDSDGNGRVITVEAGSYGNRTFSGQDQEWIFQDGVEMGVVTISSAARRLHFRSENRGGCETGQWNMNAASEDIFWDGVVQTEALYADGSNDDRNYFAGCSRVAILNCDLLAGSHSLYAAGVDDFIIANTRMSNPRDLKASPNPQANVRIMSCNNLVFVDNHVLDGTNESEKHNFRLHADAGGSSNLFVEGNLMSGLTGPGNGMQVSNSSSNSFPTGDFEDIWFRNNKVYHFGFLYLLYSGWDGFPFPEGTEESQRPINFRLQDNEAYTDGSQQWIVTSGDGDTPPGSWTISGNTVSAYEAPPAWDFDTWQNP